MFVSSTAFSGRCISLVFQLKPLWVSLRWLEQTNMQTYSLDDQVPPVPVKVHFTRSVSVSFRHHAIFFPIYKATIWSTDFFFFSLSTWYFRPCLMPASGTMFFRRYFELKKGPIFLLSSCACFCCYIAHPSARLLVYSPTV